jgi:type II secretory pathway pseudopilin PulG
MLLVVSLMTIAALAALPDFIFELKRDQEQEMIHRGVQYTRAIRIYYRQLGRYPTRLEDLENTNNLRYLRKRYKDPLTGKDFKLLHFGDPGLQLGGTIGGGLINGATPAGAAMNGPSGGSSFGNSGSSSFGNSFGSSNSSSFGSSSFGNSSFGGSNSGSNGVNTSGVFSQSSSFGGSSNAGSNSNPQNSPSPAANSSSPDSTSSQNAQANGQGDTSSSGQQVIASGPIVGVASLSKNKTIRVFNKKTKYNEWQFIYDPTADRGGLITTPYQPPLQGFGGQPLQPGQNSSQSGSSSNSPFGGSSGSSFGQSSFGQGSGQSSFGQPSSGFGNNSNSSGSNSSSNQQQ